MLQRGDTVIVRKSGLRGVVRYVGETKFKTGLWIGLELELQRGKNDGSVRDVRYFECRPNHGLFLREQSVQIVSRAGSTSRFEARGKLFYFSSESRSWISKGDGYVNVSAAGVLTMRKEFTKRFLIEYDIDEITKIETSVGSQGKAWVFNVMSDDSDEDEIVYALRFENLKDATSFRSSLDSTTSPPTPPEVKKSNDLLQRLTSPSTTTTTTTTTSPSRRLTIDTPVHIQKQIVTEEEKKTNTILQIDDESRRPRGSSLIVPESPLIPPGVDLVQQDHFEKKKRSSVVPTGHSAITRKGYSPDPSHKPYNQDAMVVERDDVSGAFLFCVFDGHGEFGHRVSKYFESRIAQEIFAHPDFPVRIDVAMCESVLRLERLMLRSGSFDCSLSGTLLFGIGKCYERSTRNTYNRQAQQEFWQLYSTVSSPSQILVTLVSLQSRTEMVV